MRRHVSNSAAAILILLLAWYYVAPFFRYYEGEAGELYDCYLMGNKKSADAFFDKLDSALKAEQFVRTGGPTPYSIFINSEGAQTYWYKGSYCCSLPLTVAVMRDGPQLTSFHISYLWNWQGFSDIQPKMRQSTSAMSAFLRDWAEDHGAGDFYVRK